MWEFFFFKISHYINIVVHGLQESIEGMEFTLEADQSSQGDDYLRAIEKFFAKIMKHVHLDSSGLLQILIMRISP